MTRAPGIRYEPPVTMRLLPGSDLLDPCTPRPAVGIGNFDGVHLGHRALVHAARARAAGEGLRTLAMFFDPHPTSVLAPERAPTLLTTPTRRAGLLRSAGADDVLVLPFDQTFASMSPEANV